MKLKVHQILLLVFSVFILGMILSTIVDKLVQNNQKIKSEIQETTLIEKVQPAALEFLKKINSELVFENIQSADFHFFKNKRNLIIHLKDLNQSYIYKMDFINLSPGFGLREKMTQLTPSEGKYTILYSGYNKLSGLFARVDYPPEKFKDYQKIQFESLKLDPFLISEKSISYSFIQVDKELISFLVYLTLKLPKEKIQMLIYPDVPPLTMELGGTEFESEIYRNLETEYNLLKEIMDIKKVGT